jgi:3-deoxy-7-phosphoheptulonate synthase
MLVIMARTATEQDISDASAELRGICERVDVSRGAEYTVICLVGDETRIDTEHIGALHGVERVVRVAERYKLVALAPRGAHSVVRIGGVPFGGGSSPAIAGPCAVESYDQVLTAGKAVKAAGARVLRAEAYKSRTGPYDFQGLGEEGLEIMQEVSRVVGLPYCVEVLSAEHIELADRYGAACLRIGTRNASNSALLQALGRQPLPVMIKRGMAATLEEWLMAAEYVAAAGNSDIILCERGIRTFERATRNTLDVSAIPMLKGMTHLPVIGDPSHGSGVKRVVAPLALALIAAGADGVMMDVHPQPEAARVDGAHALLPAEFAELMPQLRQIGAVVGTKV